MTIENCWNTWHTIGSKKTKYRIPLEKIKRWKNAHSIVTIMIFDESETIYLPSYTIFF